MKNYYLILGVDSKATQEEIKTAYRQHAKDLHPDYYGPDSSPFLDLQEAYAVLSDPMRRRLYDKTYGHVPVSRGPADASAEPLIPRPPIVPEPLIPMEDQVDLGSLSLGSSFRTIHPSYEELFDRIWRNFSLSRPKVERLRQLNVEININSYEALRGGRVQLLVPARLRCPRCHGRGGTGFFECWQCEGAGVVQGEYPLAIAFPPGIVNNYVIQVPLDRLGIDNFFLNVIFRVSHN
jgi:DnaJ-class molecular chaperone